MAEMILVVDDDPDIARFVEVNLRSAGYDVSVASDGEEAIIAAFRTCWPGAHPQRCQSHWLSNVAEPVLKVDTQLREQMRQDLGGLPAVPEQAETPAQPTPGEPSPEAPPFCQIHAMLS